MRFFGQRQATGSVDSEIQYQGSNCSILLRPFAWAFFAVAVFGVLLFSHRTSEAHKANPQVDHIKELALEKLTMVGPNGEPRGSIATQPDGGTELVLSDGKGSSRITIGVTKDGASRMILNDTNNQQKITLMNPTKGAPYLSFQGSSGKGLITMQTGEEGTPQIFFSDKDGVTKMSLGIGADGLPFLLLGANRKGGVNIGFVNEHTPNISLLGNDDTLRLTLSFGQLGPLVALFDKGNVNRTSWAVLQDGTPQLCFRDEKGRIVLELTLDKKEGAQIRQNK